MVEKKFIHLNSLCRILPFTSATYLRQTYTCTALLKDIFVILQFLKDHVNCQYKVLSNLSVVDYPNRDFRFEIVYELLSIRYNERLRLKTWADEGHLVISIISLYPCANWNEREAWDLFGVNFSSHKDLRRILTDYGFQGHPIRKDFPLSGFVESRYYEDKKRLVTESANFDQSFRVYDYHSPLTIETKNFL